MPTIDWKLTYDQFEAMIARMVDSAPGPDGLPYAVWRCSPEPFRKLLYAMYCAWLDGAALSDGFNHAYLALIAKGDDEQDADLVSRAPEDTRPLSLSNTDAKILAAAVKEACEEPVSSWACGVQRGFTRNKMLIDNVIEIEAHAMAASMASNTSAMLFWDFAAAFPSVAHVFI